MTNYCADGGYLVGGRELVPDDPTVYRAQGGPWVGCSRLVCRTCKATVRHAPGLGVRTPAAGVRVFHAPDWTRRIEGLERRQDSDRLYVCGCHYHVESSSRACEVSNPSYQDFSSPWTCAGHPVVRLPFEHGGHVVAADTDLPALVRAVSEVGLATFAPALYDRLAGHPLATAVARAAAGLLDDGDPRVRAGALDFFAAHPDALGAERVGEVAVARPDLFSGVGDPFVKGRELSDRLHRALASRLELRVGGDTNALRVARSAASTGALREGTRLLECLVAADLAWVVRHAAAIARTSRRAYALLRAVAAANPRSVGPAAKVLVGAGVLDRLGVRRHAARNMRGPALDSVDEALRR